MKTIIAEKPSVAREIARIVGAAKREEGYFEGGGYAVTWAFGHLVQLAMPDGYGICGFVRDNLPVIPDTFTLVSRQVKTEKGYKPDSSVVAQIKTVARLFKESEQIIVATDAGREGELIFRYLYHYTGCTTPFVRLWISSLTDKAIREGLRNLEAGDKYDNLYLAAKARSESDWLVGINGTQALSIAAGHGTYSVGRVQTPTLAMVCARYWENRRFTPEAFWQLHIATDGCDEGTVKFSSSEKWKEKESATELYNKVKSAGTATVTKAERKEKTEETPLLYDLTTLQKEANAKHGFTAEQTLEIAQKLYEKKLITYPRTGSRYIPEDVFAEIPKLLAFIGSLPEWKGKLQPKAVPTRRSLDGGKVTDHHALLVTGEKPLFLSKEDSTVYHMIVGRMLEAFSEKCVKDTATVTAECAGVEFVAKGSIIRQAGWRAVYGKENGEENNSQEETAAIPCWQEGDTLALKAASITEGKTKPKPLHTEATLLSAMETAGKEIEDDALRQAMKDCGIGTPATRASIIETLFKRGYMERCKKSLVPTEKGLALYSVVKAISVKALPEPSLESSVNCTLLFCLAKKERKYVMAKIQLLAVISIDGCPMKLHPRKRLLQTEDYGMDEIRANALYKLTSDYSVSVLQEWREEGGSICHLLEVTAGNTEYANGLLRMNVIDEIILYVVPTIDGNGAHFFKSALPMNDWRLMENKTYRDGVIRLTYHKEPRA